MWLERSASWVWRGLVIVAGLYVAARVFGALRIVLVPVFIAALLTAAISPAVRFLRRLGLQQAPSAAIVFVTSLALAAGILVGIGSLIGGELQEAEWNAVREDVETWLMDGPAGLSEQEIDDLEDRITGRVAGGLGQVSFDRVQLISSLTGATLLTVVLFFFFLKDAEQMWRWIVARVRPVRRPALDEAGRSAAEALAGYMRGVAIAGLADGVSIAVAMALVGVPLAAPIGVLTAFAAFLPVVGAIFAGAVAVLVALVFNGPQDAFIIGLAALAVQQIEGNVLVPYVMGRQVSLHPAAVLVALAIGGAAAGIAGAFLAVPLLAMTVAALGAARSVAVPAEPAGDG